MSSPPHGPSAEPKDGLASKNWLRGKFQIETSSSFRKSFGNRFYFVGGKRVMAPEVGLEPTTSRLTAACSTIELLWTTVAGAEPSDAISKASKGFCIIYSYTPPPTCSRARPGTRQWPWLQSAPRPKNCLNPGIWSRSHVPSGERIHRGSQTFIGSRLGNSFCAGGVARIRASLNSPPLG